jgi:ankyrin repeat protein
VSGVQDDILDTRITPDQQAVVDRFLLDAVNDYKYDRIDLTLKKGANIDARDDKGLTPLMRAINLGDIYGVKFILARGPDLFVRDKYNRNAFDLLPYVQDSNTRNQMTDAMLSALPDGKRGYLSKTFGQEAQVPQKPAETPPDTGSDAGNAASRRKTFNP